MTVVKTGMLSWMYDCTRNTQKLTWQVVEIDQIPLDIQDHVVTDPSWDAIPNLSRVRLGYLLVYHIRQKNVN